MNLSVCTTWLTSVKQEITGIWIVGDETARCLQIQEGSQQLLLGLPLHKIPDARAASVQNFGNVAFIVNDFDGPDFQLIQVGYSELSVMNAMHVCSMLSIIFFFRLWSKPKRPKMLLGVAVASWAPPLSRPWSKQLKPHQQLAETWSKALHDRCTAIPWTTWAFASTGENRSLKKEKLHLSIKGGACTAIYWLADHQSGSIFSSNLQHLIKVRGGQGVKN